VTSRSTLLFHLAVACGRLSRERRKISSRRENLGADELVHMTHMSRRTSAQCTFPAVVQDYLLPTAAYIAGPAEISYFAQSQVVYRHLLGRMPVVLPRAGSRWSTRRPRNF